MGLKHALSYACVIEVLEKPVLIGNIKDNSK